MLLDDLPDLDIIRPKIYGLHENIEWERNKLRKLIFDTIAREFPEVIGYKFNRVVFSLIGVENKPYFHDDDIYSDELW